MRGEANRLHPECSNKKVRKNSRGMRSYAKLVDMEEIKRLAREFVDGDRKAQRRAADMRKLAALTEKLKKEKKAKNAQA
jgi:hypothetical protein